MVSRIEDRISLARELLEVARDEFAKAEEAKGGAAVIGLRNACGKGWLAALEATNYYFLMQGVPESELPQNDRGRYFFVDQRMERELRRAYIEMRQTFHIFGYYEGILEFENVPRYFGELEGYINDIEAAGRNDAAD